MPAPLWRLLATLAVPARALRWGRLTTTWPDHPPRFRPGGIIPLPRPVILFDFHESTLDESQIAEAIAQAWRKAAGQ